MDQYVTRTGLLRIATLTVALMFILLAYYPFSPAGRQAREVKRAEKHDELLNRELLLDPRFQQVTVYTCVGESIFLEVEGEVASWSNGQKLVDLVRESVPPVPVRWAVSLPMTAVVHEVSLTGAQEKAEMTGSSKSAQ